VSTGETFPLAARVVDVDVRPALKLVPKLSAMGFEAAYDGYAVEFLAGPSQERAFGLAVDKLRSMGLSVLLG